MLTEALSAHIKASLKRDLLEYNRREVYCRGKIKFNFQINTKINIDKPFSSHDISYENQIANYFCGEEAHINTNGGGVVVIRGATGSGKTSAIRRGIYLAELKLKQRRKREKLDVVWLELNNLDDSILSASKREMDNYIWRTLAVEIENFFEYTPVSETDRLPFLYWLKNHSNITAKIRNIFQFFELNSKYLDAISSGSGLHGLTVVECEQLVDKEWKLCVSSVSDQEYALYKIACLRFALQKSDNSITHRVIVVDNVDHLPPDFQRTVVNAALWMSEFLGVRLLIAVRPLTWENQHGHKSLDLEEHLSPSLADVLVTRLEYIRDFEFSNTHEHETVNALIRELRIEKAHLRNMLYGASGVSLRAALRNFRNFLSSPILFGTQLSFPSRRDEHLKPSEIARAFFLGPDDCIDHDNIDDLFSVGGSRDPRRALIKPRLLDYILRIQTGRARISEVIAFVTGFGFSRGEIVAAINELMLRKRSLLWCDALGNIENGEGLEGCATIAISPMGASYYGRLYGEYLYTEACLANDQTEKVPSWSVVEFSKNLIAIDEEQITLFVDANSGADYYSAYGVDIPSISFVYWRRFFSAAVRRQSVERAETLDEGWESRIRAFVGARTGKDYFPK